MNLTERVWDTLVAVRWQTEVFCQPTASGSVDGYASWPITAASATTVNVTSTACDETYGGSATRVCNSDGTWGAVQTSCIRTLRFRPPF